MRFLFFDRFLEMELGKRALAIKSVSLADEYFPEHYPRTAIMPATLVVECLAQVGGWLHIASNGFSIRTVLGLIEGVTILRQTRPGDQLLLAVSTLYVHQDGATLAGEARVGDEVVVRVERMLFASERVRDAGFSARERALFDYVSGGFPAPDRRES